MEDSATHAQEIKQATAEAKKVIREDAAEAVKLIQDAADNARKVVSVKSAEDHDQMIRDDQSMRDFIKNMSKSFGTLKEQNEKIIESLGKKNGKLSAILITFVLFISGVVFTHIQTEKKDIKSHEDIQVAFDSQIRNLKSKSNFNSSWLKVVDDNKYRADMYFQMVTFPPEETRGGSVLPFPNVKIGEYQTTDSSKL